MKIKSDEKNGNAVSNMKGEMTGVWEMTTLANPQSSIFQRNHHQIGTEATCASNENKACQDNRTHIGVASLYFYLLIMSFSDEVARSGGRNGEVSESLTQRQLYSQ